MSQLAQTAETRSALTPVQYRNDDRNDDRNDAAPYGYPYPRGYRDDYSHPWSRPMPPRTTWPHHAPQDLLPLPSRPRPDGWWPGRLYEGQPVSPACAAVGEEARHAAYNLLPGKSYQDQATLLGHVVEQLRGTGARLTQRPPALSIDRALEEIYRAGAYSCSPAVEATVHAAGHCDQHVNDELARINDSLAGLSPEAKVEALRAIRIEIAGLRGDDGVRRTFADHIEREQAYIANATFRQCMNNERMR